MGSQIFDRLADRYDAWFDTPRGAVIFAAEVECVRRLVPPVVAGWVEMGVGSGRFAAALGIGEGVDRSVPLLRKAAARGINTIAGSAESLPYESRSLQGILLVVTLCFLDEPELAMREFVRVLKDGGELLVGIVPSDSSWGEHYRLEGQQGHPFYSVARFYTCAEVIEMASAVGLQMVKAASTLPGGPDGGLQDVAVQRGIVPGSGFVAMLFCKGPPRSQTEQ